MRPGGPKTTSHVDVLQSEKQPDESGEVHHGPPHLPAVVCAVCVCLRLSTLCTLVYRDTPRKLDIHFCGSKENPNPCFIGGPFSCEGPRIFWQTPHENALGQAGPRKGDKDTQARWAAGGLLNRGTENRLSLRKVLGGRKIAFLFGKPLVHFNDWKGWSKTWDHWSSRLPQTHARLYLVWEKTMDSTGVFPFETHPKRVPSPG